MKKCTYCGQEHPDEATVCVLDQQPLTIVESNPLATNKLMEPGPGLFPPKKVGLVVREKDNGLWLVWKCPRCLVETNFNAIVSHGNVELIGLELSPPITMLDLRCERCKFELRVAPSERESLEKLRDITRHLIEGNIPRAEYEAQVLEMPAQFVKDLAALTQNWKCPSCGEENPVSFDTCWNCSSRENGSTDKISEDAKPFPTIPRGGNSWEQ